MNDRKQIVVKVSGFVALLGMLAAVSITSCSSTKKATTGTDIKENKKANRNIACGEQSKQLSQPHLDWAIEENSVLDNLTSMPKPSSYKVYSVDSVQVRSFFQAARSAENNRVTATTILPLPAPFECRVYTLTESGAMSPKLKEKFPNMVALQGQDAEGKGNVRMEFDGSQIKGQVIRDGQVYMISPVRNNDKIYYMVYLRADSGEKKEHFEQNINPGKEIKYDR